MNIPAQPDKTNGIKPIVVAQKLYDSLSPDAQGFPSMSVGLEYKDTDGYAHEATITLKQSNGQPPTVKCPSCGVQAASLYHLSGKASAHSGLACKTCFNTKGAK